MLLWLSMILRAKSKLPNLVYKAFKILVHTSLSGLILRLISYFSLLSYHSGPLFVFQWVLVLSHLYEIYQTFALPRITFFFNCQCLLILEISRYRFLKMAFVSLQTSLAFYFPICNIDHSWISFLRVSSPIGREIDCLIYQCDLVT